MEEVFPPYHVFINHRGPDVKRTLASLIYHRLEGHGLRVFLDKHELQAGDSLTPAIKSAICSASVQIAIFSKTYAQSAWCLNELLWMFDSRSSIIIPIFYDIQPSDLRHVDQGAYAGAFQQHREKGRVTIQQLESWISALNKVSAISGVVISTEEDDLGERLEEIVEIILKEVRREDLDVGKYPVGLRQAAEHFEREVLNPSEISGIKDTLRGRSMLRDRLRGLKRVLIVFDDMANTEQVENLLFVKDVVGNGSLILVTSRDQTLFVSSNIEIYNIKLLDSENAQELFYWHAFGHSEPVDDLQNMVEELVGMCSGFPLALKVLAGQFHNEHDPGKWKKELDSLRKQLPNNILKQIVKDSYKSLDIREREAFLDIAHFLNGEDVDLAEKVLDGLNGSGTQCLRTLRRKCLVEYESADIILPTTIRAEFVSWRRGVWRRAKGSLKVRMHDLVRDLARQIGREELPLRFCCRKHTVVPRHVSDISVDSLPRSSCTDFLTCAPNISTAVLSGKSMKMEAVDKMDRVARRFEGIKVRSSLESAQLERTVKLKGAIFLYLITDQDCNIEVTFFGHVYTAHSSRFEYPVHILMWTKDSEVYKDFKSSSDKARDFSWLKTPIKKGWIVQAENSEVCKRFISYLFVEGYI
ncbi:hypothetical protein SUGI_0468800 [Cryptomeria japonica]|nr:hypothetical protein SUGI_0468800 [Cryptomeria japonica]